MQCKSLWIKASAKCINVIIRSVGHKIMFNPSFLAGLNFEYVLGNKNVLALFSDVLMTNNNTLLKE